MKYYFFKSKVVALSDDVEIYPLYNRFSERYYGYVALNETQTAFYLTHQNLTVQEIDFCREDTELTNEIRRKQAYMEEIPREYIDSYITYQAEGKTEKANKVAEKIAAIKERIRIKYPEE